MLQVNNSQNKNKLGDGSNPFDEEDVGKRFMMLKQQMNVQENGSVGGGGARGEDAADESADLALDMSSISVPGHGSVSVQLQTPAGPASGGNSVQPKKSKKALSSLNYNS